MPFNGPCYRCFYPEPPPPDMAPSCQEAGVLGVLCGVIGSLQAVEAIKVLLGIGKPLSGRQLSFDALDAEVPRVQAPARSDLPGVRRRQKARGHRAHRLPGVLQRQGLATGGRSLGAGVVGTRSE